MRENRFWGCLLRREKWKIFDGSSHFLPNPPKIDLFTLEREHGESLMPIDVAKIPTIVNISQLPLRLIFFIFTTQFISRFFSLLQLVCSLHNSLPI